MYEADCNCVCDDPHETRSDNEICQCPASKEGCPVTDECGIVCGETRTLGIIKEFKKIYDDCLSELEENCGCDKEQQQKLISSLKCFLSDLWEQNTLLVKTVEELEAESFCRIKQLQSQLCQVNEKVNRLKCERKKMYALVLNYKDTLKKYVQCVNRDGKSVSASAVKETCH